MLEHDHDVEPGRTAGHTSGPTAEDDDQVGKADPPPSGEHVPTLHLRVVLVVAAAFVAVELAVSPRYGFHRDELYFLACARHLAWGYVDQPPFVPAVARVATDLFGTSPTSLRLLPAVFGGFVVVLSACLAREIGGARRAQLLAATAAATSGQVLAAMHLLSTAAFDVFFWAAVLLTTLRLLRTGDTRWWLAVGSISGVALLNKYNVLFLLVALGVGILATPQRRLLHSRWLVAGAAIALAIWTPNIIWNAQHRWAEVAMLRSLHRENSTLGASLAFIPSQIVIAGPVLVWFWIAGWRRLARHDIARPLAIAYAVLVVADVLAGAKAYYLSGYYVALFAGGGLWFEERLAARRRTTIRPLALFVAGALAALPLTLPVLPVDTLARRPWEGKLNKDLSATVGWENAVRQVATVVDTLPPAERKDVVLLTGDYGMAGAIDLYGPRYGLPGAISGHNSYWWWGPHGAADTATTIAINMPTSILDSIFSTVVPAGRIETGHGVWTEEQGDSIVICRSQITPWASAWNSIRDYG